MRANLKYIPFYPLFALSFFTIKNGGVSFRSLPIFLAFILRYILLEPFRFLEVIFFTNKIKNHKLTEDPIFIIGHWRSGTSHMQNMISKDPGNTTTSLYHFIFADCYYLTEKWLKNPMNYFLKTFGVKYNFQRVKMNLDLPGELDSGLCASMSPYGYTWAHLFPKRFGKIVGDNLIITNQLDAENWVNDYDFLIKKRSYQAQNKRLVIKSPGDTAKIRLLVKKYPNAKFIYMHRSPIEVFHSTKYLWSVIQKENSFQRIPSVMIDNHIISTYKLLLREYLDSRSTLIDNQLIEVRFKEVQNKPNDVLSSIYKKLELGIMPENIIAPFLDKNKSYKVNKYETSQELKQKLTKEWQFSFDAWSES